MALSLRQILLGRNCKILDAFCSITMAVGLQFLIFCTRFQVQRQIQQNPDLAHNSYKYIFEGMVVTCAFCLSFIFFVLALVKYLNVNKKKEGFQHRYITLATKVLLFIVGILLVFQSCLITYNMFSPYFGSIAKCLSGFRTWILNILTL